MAGDGGPALRGRRSVAKWWELADVRYFTMAWWGGFQAGEGDDPSADYAAHLNSIRDRLPPDLLATEEAVSLHDTRLRELCLLAAEGMLRIGLDSYTGDDRLTLVYSGVERFESTVDPESGLRGPSGYGDLGYCEVDILPGGAFEHRLLFSTGIELAVIFRGFRLQSSYGRDCPAHSRRAGHGKPCPTKTGYSSTSSGEASPNA